MRPAIAEHFDDNVFWGGLTYNTHPLGVAAALATLQVTEDDDLVGNARRLDPVMRAHHEELAERHPSVGRTRNLGLFGILELVKDRETMEPLSRERFLAGALLPAAWYMQAQRLRAWYREQVQRLFADVDVLIAAATPCPATPIGEELLDINGQRLPLRASRRVDRARNRPSDESPPAPLRAVDCPPSRRLRVCRISPPPHPTPRGRTARRQSPRLRRDQTRFSLGTDRYGRRRATRRGTQSISSSPATTVT